MTRFLRDILGLLLAALVAITALHVGAARGQAQAVGSIVLCTGTGPVVVTVDADGQPTGHVATCPDCVMSILAGLDAPPAFLRHAVPVRRLAFGRVRVRGRSNAVRCSQARGPPHLS